MNKIEETKDKLMNNLIDLRIEKGLSQKDVSEAIGISQTAFAKFEQGLCDIKLSVVLKYFEMLDLNINDMFKD